MNMKRLFSFIVILIISINIFTGCVDTGYQTSENIETVTIVDCVGRTVDVPKKIERIGCLFTVTGHVVTMLGEGEKIVAVSNGLKRDKLLHRICPSILDAIVPKVSGSVNIEELARSKPDVVFIDHEALLDEREAKKFDKLKIPYLVIKFNDIEEQQYMVEMIGKALGKEDKAKKYIKFYNECISKTKDGVKKIQENEKLTVYHSVNEATRTDAPNTLPADWTNISGVINVSVGKKLKFTDNKYFASLEQILLWNPDVIIVNEDGVDEYIRTMEQWQSLKAVKNDKVILLPNGISRWGHTTSIETPLAIIWLSKKLYPSYFEDVNIREITKEFYEKFYNYNLSDDEVNDILRGKGMRKPKH